MKKIATLTALIALVLTGCEKPTSNLDARSPGGRIMYPITADEADAVIFRALRSTVPGADRARVRPRICSRRSTWGRRRSVRPCHWQAVRLDAMPAHSLLIGARVRSAAAA